MRNFCSDASRNEACQANGAAQGSGYAPPRLRVIELAAEEVLVSGCKVFFGGPGQGEPTGCATSSPCSDTIGS